MRNGLRAGLLAALALAATSAYFIVALVFPLLMKLIPGNPDDLHHD